MQKIILFASIALLSACSSLGSSAGKEKWSCSAYGLINSSYSGSDYAYIHLQQFKKGGSYPVTLNAQKTIATGKAKNKTPFECRVVK